MSEPMPGAPEVEPGTPEVAPGTPEVAPASPAVAPHAPTFVPPATIEDAVRMATRPGGPGGPGVQDAEPSGPGVQDAGPGGPAVQDAGPGGPSAPHAPDASGVVYRAGGTDLTETRRYGAHLGPIVDLGGIGALRGVGWDGDGAARIGSMTTLAELLSDARVRDAYPGMVEAVANIAGPHIRAVATVGGNLLQSTRCWYYRSHAYRCMKKGGSSCPSREGNNLFGVCFDLGPCVAPHPSTLGMALLTYDAAVEYLPSGAHDTSDSATLAIADLYGDGSDPSRDHQLPPGAILTAVRMPEPLPGERASYVRSNARAVAEWPLVEVLVRLSADGSVARVAIGGVANIPMRLGALERVLVEAPGDWERAERAVDAVIEAATPMPMAGFKLRVLRGALLDALHGALGYR